MNNGVLKIFCDGGSRGNPGPGASGFVVIDAGGKIIFRQGNYLGYTTNNQAEYAAVIQAFKFLREQKNNAMFSSPKLEFYLDSELVTKQLRGEYRIKDIKLQPLATEVKRLEKNLTIPVIFISIPRSKNKLADAMVNKSLDAKSDVFFIE